MFLETERLYLRQIVADDLEAVFALDRDPEVMRYIKPPFTEKSQAREYIQQVREYNEKHPGLGRWAMLERATNAFVGVFLLKDLEGTEEIEVGYRMHRRFWGRGYATEMTKAVLQYGFGQLGLRRIVAIAQPANRASTHVMEKCGLRFEKKAYHYQTDVVLYAIEKTLVGKIEVRPGSIGDILAVYPDIPELQRPPGADEYRKRLFGAPKHLLLVAYAGSEPVGFKAGYEREPDGSFYSWMGGVAHPHRRRGIAYQLARAMETWAMAQGYRALRCKTRNAHKPMLLFALSNGFDIVGVEPRDSVGAHRITLEKKL
ncbi:MAG: GNAT family N-acetyltransferase [Ferruginibacter sp.]|nr:GNAT family N-acetyltransferase [Cytophagales bacterium]